MTSLGEEQGRPGLRHAREPARWGGLLQLAPKHVPCRTTVRDPGSTWSASPVVAYNLAADKTAISKGSKRPTDRRLGSLHRIRELRLCHRLVATEQLGEHRPCRRAGDPDDGNALFHPEKRIK